MPYRCLPLFASPLVQWNELQLDSGRDAKPAWGDVYHVDSPRLLVPLTNWIECRLPGGDVVCDAASALWLTPETGYRMRQPQPTQRSVSVILPSFDAPVGIAPVPAAAQAALRLWIAAQRRAPLEDLDLEEKLTTLASTALAPTVPRGAPAHRAVERAREFLARHPTADASLAQIAQAAHCSAYHLARLFRRATGRSLHAYRTQLRMTLALQHLEDGATDLARLATDLGYAHHSHFTAAFRRCFGVAPSRLREAWRNVPRSVPGLH